MGVFPPGPEDGGVEQGHHEQEDPVDLQHQHQQRHHQEDPADQVDEESSGAPDRSQQLGASRRGGGVEIIQVVTGNEKNQRDV